MSTEAALLGTPRVINFDGADYQVGLITGKVKAEFERLFAARALERLAKQKQKFTKSQYQQELRAIGEREDRGEFALMGSAGMTTIITTSWGQRTILKLLMPTCPVETLERILDERFDEINWLIQRVIEESMPTTTKKAKEQDPFVPEQPESPPSV